ncbi:MAG: hypothetical protein AAGI23_09820 [Bacteroidota bacterium]
MSILNRTYSYLLSATFKEKSERLILAIAIISYVIHLIFIVLSQQGIISVESKFLNDPIAAIYTPFSFILIYEVYLLIFYLPKSISFYIGKQYEIITLIVIRRIFKDIASIKLTSEWFKVRDDLQFTYDVATSLILFVIIYLFYKNIRQSSNSGKRTTEEEQKITRFVNLKKGISVLLVPILFVLASFTLFHWLKETISEYGNGVLAFKNINNVFFDEFFTLLIIVDVMLLLASFFYSHQFHKIIRNSGFVISTILIKVSFSVTGIVNNALIIGAVLFGFLILLIHNLYEKNESTQMQM